MKGKIHVCRKIMAFGISVLSAMAMVSCTDDSMTLSEHSADSVRFQVTCVSTDDPACRSMKCGKSQATAVLPLRGGDIQMYLVPDESEVTDAEDITTAGIYAMLPGAPGGMEMRNEEIDYDGNWIPKGTYSWPDEGSLSIYAYSPYCGSVGSQGVTSLPEDGSGALCISFATASDISDQSDLLWAEPTDAHSSPCDLAFRHAMTHVVFTAGAELPPCTVSKIELKNISSKGKLDIKTGMWSDLDGQADFTVEPDVELAAAEGSEFVEQGVSLIADDDDDADGFYMIPQELGPDAMFVVTIDKDGQTIELNAPAGGSLWRNGRTVTYRLSTNPAKEGLRFDIDGEFSTPFTGGKVDFKLTSEYEGSGETSQMAWTAEFIDAYGNPTDRPVWIKDFPEKGDGSGDFSYTTEVIAPEFKAISPQSKTLQSAQDINVRTGYDPYNLANSDGGAEVENTANCYIVNAPGRYSLPLVYGNGMKDSQPNPGAYTSKPGDSRVLQRFINHLGEPITDPYIFNNRGCMPAEASLVWEDRIGLLRDVRLASDGRSLSFEVPRDFIRQGNALVAVRDKDGAVLWSWQIWVTDYDPAESYVNVKTDQGLRRMYAKSIGAVRGGDELCFPEADAYVRFSQMNVPSGSEPRSVTVKIHQCGLINTTVDYNTYYQWGRKDPIIADKKRWFDAGHKELNELSMKSAVRNVPEGKTLVECMIGSPSEFWKSVPGYRYRYVNLWNSAAPGKPGVKTVYDPSPVGAKVPEGEFLMQLLKSCSMSWGTSGNTPGFFVSGPGIEGELFFTALGYRRRQTGLDEATGTAGEYWSSQAGADLQDAVCLSLSHGNCGSITTDDGDFRGRALGVRPVQE